MLKSPFRSNSMETDPWVYGLRPVIIKNTITELFNDKSILITGSRGIGKSSLSYQLQRILSGDKTILQRCALDIKLKRYITIDYICNPDDTLESVVQSLVEKIENRIDEFKTNYEVKSSRIELSLLGFIKTNFEIIKKNRVEFKTLTESFIQIVERLCDCYIEPHINIAIDELDQLNDEQNIAHFTKVVLEMLNRKGISALSFIFVGQSTLFSRLNAQQPAFHRLVKHYNIKPLDYDNSEYVLDACLRRATVNTNIELEAKVLLLNIASGYPYSLQLLGHETFYCMLERFYDVSSQQLEITEKDFLSGLQNALISDKERFNYAFNSLSELEQYYIRIMADETQSNIPYTYNCYDIIEGVSNCSQELRYKQTVDVLQSLCEKQILSEIGNMEMFKKWEDRRFRFTEEIFRVFLFYMMHYEIPMDYV